jgi:hypothetical protein
MTWFLFSVHGREETAYETARVVERQREEKVDEEQESGQQQEQQQLAVLPPPERMIGVIEIRLSFLEPYVKTWSQAMALGMTPSNAPTTARNLALLADEVRLRLGG